MRWPANEGPTSRIRDRDRRQDQPRSRHARVYVSVLGDAAHRRAEQREASLAGLRSAHGFLQARIAGELRLKRTPTLEFILRRHDRPRDAPRGAPRRDRPVVSEPSTRRAARRASRCSSALREDERFVLVTHENPDGDALGSLVAMQGAADARSARTRSCSSRPTSSRCPTSTAFFELDGADPRRRRRHRRAHGRVPGLRQHRPQLGRACCATARTCSTSTTTTTTPTSAHQPRRRRRVVHGRDRLGPDARARRRARRRAIAEALYVGLVTDTGRFMYENTGPRAHLMAAELIEAGVDVPAIYRRLYEDMPPAKLALLARALGQRAALRRRRADARRARAPRTSSEPAPRRATPRGSSTTCARCRARRSPRSSASCSSGERRASARCRCARPTTTSTCRSIARAQGGGGHRHAAGFSTDARAATS